MKRALPAALRRTVLRVLPAAVTGRRRRRVFTDIYRSNGWGEAETVSGPGSTRARTAALRGELGALLEELGVRSLLDAGCGDCNWILMPGAELERYVGVEVVPALVAANRERHGGPGREFLCLDLVHQRLPRADLIFSRDCLVHLPNAHILGALRNFRRSGARFLLTTTFRARGENPDVPIGGWRPINLEARPFDLPQPLRTLDDAPPGYPDKVLGLWRLADLG